MRIVVIVENETRGRLRSEIGLSLMLETNTKSVLIDAGASDLVVENLKKKGYLPERIENIVISHNHRDHIGGLEALLMKNDVAEVYVSENAQGEYVKCKDGVIEVLSDYYLMMTMPERFVKAGDIAYIGDDIALCCVRKTDKKYTGKNTYLKKIVNVKLQDDDFRHELYVAAFEGDSYNIISPCSHNGIVNIIRDAKERFPDKTLNAYIGGLHIQGKESSIDEKTAAYVVRIAKKLNTTGLKALYTCHCTGRQPYRVFKELCDFPVKYITTGDEIEV